MQPSDELINELSDICGIVPEYWDIFGKKHSTSIETKKAVLSAMKLDINSADKTRNEINKLKGRPWNSFIEPVKVISVNEQPLSIPVYMPVREGDDSRLALSWSIKDEKGQIDDYSVSGNAVTISDCRWIDNVRYLKIDLNANGSRDIGYYSVNITGFCPGTAVSGKSKIIITPDSCYIPPQLGKPGTSRIWGLYLNLYSIRSSQNWGIGDFTDLKKITAWIAGLGGSFVGINPLHAIANRKPGGISPYSPISRLYRNFIYIDVEDIQEFKERNKAGAITGLADFARLLEELRSSDLIDYEKIASLKNGILLGLFDVFYEKLKHNGRCLERVEDFKKYVSEEGETLDSYATYMALCESFKDHGAESPSLITCFDSWQEWPAEYHDPSGKAVQEFKERSEKHILFYKYVQWLADRQLGEAAELAKRLDMPVGLYNDLAIGSIGGGSDAWNYQDVIAGGTDVGAPPDGFNLKGQNWGFPPIVPEGLKKTGYKFFIQAIRKNMKYGGALRIDHALGMFRLFWIPSGMPASHGAYLKYPSEDLLRIIALESVRNKTIVIAEDLGTIGENVRETLLRFRMLSYRLLYFERNYPDPSFTRPGKYPDMALCSVTTHDLPTIYGYWSGRDIEVKKRLGMFPDESSLHSHISERERDKALLFEALKSAGAILEGQADATSAMTPELCLAIYEYLAKTSCKLATVSLDDAIGTMDQQNMPGITDSYPSWMQKTPVTLEQIMSDKWFKTLSERLKANNQR